MRCAGDPACVWPVVELVRDPASGGLEGFCVHHLRMLSEPDAAAAYANRELMAPARGVPLYGLPAEVRGPQRSRARPAAPRALPCQRCGKALAPHNRNGRLCGRCHAKFLSRNVYRRRAGKAPFTVEEWLGNFFEKQVGSARIAVYDQRTRRAGAMARYVGGFTVHGVEPASALQELLRLCAAKWPQAGVERLASSRPNSGADREPEGNAP